MTLPSLFRISVATRRRTLGLLSATLFAVAGAGCDSSKPAAASPAAPATAAAGTTAGPAGAIACPAQDIAGFVAAFAEDPALQKAFTAEAVDTAFVDFGAQPEPAESVERLPRDRLHFPVMPNRAQQAKEGLRYREVSADPQRTTIALEVPDTDAQLLYTFRRSQCWTLEKIVDPAFGKAFPGEAPQVAAAQGGDQAIVRAVMDQQYGAGYDRARDCWPTTFEDGGDTYDYCMRPGQATTVETPAGKQLLFLAHNVQDFGQAQRRYSYSQADSGLAGLFAVALDGRGGWTLAAADKAEPLGSAGDCACADARPTRLGRDIHGWMLASGGVWQGVVVSTFAIYAPVGSGFAVVATVPEIEEGQQDVRRKVAVDAADPAAAHYPLVVTTLRDGRQIDRAILTYDGKQKRYPAATGR